MEANRGARASPFRHGKPRLMASAPIRTARLERRYLRGLAEAYRCLELPETEAHDWAWRAERTLHDLFSDPAASRRYEGDFYLLPYPDGQYPDSMVQVAMAAAMHGLAPAAAVEELTRGMHRIYDPQVGTLRRYLPNVGEEKDYDAVDSWYLYHPMMNLARLALRGDADMRELLLKSIDYGIAAAQHFKYRWPVFYRIQDFSVTQQRADHGRPGETDAGGLYAYLMVLVHQLTGEDRYAREAQAALDAAGDGLDLMYQANLTAWGAVAAARLWHLNGDPDRLEQSYTWLANLLRHCRFTTSWAGSAAHFPTFFSNPCMYNSAYMAPFEDYECVTALDEYLSVLSEQGDPDARLLAGEYCRYAAHRAWFYYPDRLPADVIASKQESGVIRRDLSFPLEDLYPDGREAGQIGQEVYGAGQAFVYSARAAR